MQIVPKKKKFGFFYFLGFFGGVSENEFWRNAKISTFLVKFFDVFYFIWPDFLIEIRGKLYLSYQTFSAMFRSFSDDLLRYKVHFLAYFTALGF